MTVSKHLNAIVWLAVTLLLLVGLYFAMEKTSLIEAQFPLSAMPHADHTPKHGGIFFMAQDGFHHLEGTLDGSEFRLYLYDNFSRPMDSRRFRARVGNRRLEAKRNGQYLSVPLDEITINRREVTAFVHFKIDGPEDRFDFVFKPTSAPTGASEHSLADPIAP